MRNIALPFKRIGRGWKVPSNRLLILAAAALIGGLSKVTFSHDSIFQAPSESAYVIQYPIADNPYSREKLLRARVRWTLADPDADGNSKIHAEIKIPEYSQIITLSIEKNVSPEISASHLVEISVPRSEYPARSIVDVQGLSMTTDLEVPDRPLVATASQVEPDKFLVALSAHESDLTENLVLFRDNNYFSMPIEYESGQTAKLMLRKGKTGSRVFRKALRSWQEG